MDTPEAVRLRRALVARLKRRGHVRSVSVEAALKSVPRHLFTPWLDLSEAYSDRAVANPEGAPNVSTVSQPTAVALMLEAFQLLPGMRVLEVGAGSGYHAALMAHIVGHQGQVVTLDLEASLIEKARANLAATGFGNVLVVHGDGARGYASAAPFDRIVATVGLWEVPGPWAEQLSPGGEIITPLHLGGDESEHVLVRLERREGYLEGVGLGGLYMVLFRGEGAGHGARVAERVGANWRGAPSDGLNLRIYPKEADVPLKPHQKHLHKRHSLTVLEASV